MKTNFSQQHLVSTLAFWATMLALGVVALGAFTRLIDAGLGCPDWPGCYGHLAIPLAQKARETITFSYPDTPLVVYKAWAEMVHRYFAGTLSVFIVGIVIMLFKKTVRKRSNVFLALGLLVLIGYQILLGQLTVTLKLLPTIVTQHLLGGFLILSVLWLVYLNNQAGESSNDIQLKSKARFILPWAVLGLILLLLQILLGAWTSTHYAALSCPDLPFCLNNQTMIWQFREAFQLFSPIGINYEGGLLPQVVKQTIQMTHRLGAVILTTYLIILIAIAVLSLKQSLALIRPLYVIALLLCMQLCVGMANVIFKLPLMSAVAHNILAVLLLLAMITWLFKLTSKAYP
jgi:cytochrome c oxidase assembly protein subunit 15